MLHTVTMNLFKSCDILENQKLQLSMCGHGIMCYL